jgi:dTDP-4-dehydrorhamnose 3,5-epimerase
MKFNPTPLSGAFTIDLEKREDERGFFARFFCVNEFDNNNADRNIVQINNSLSKDKGTLRGIHYQLAPKAESKIVRCIKGSLFDVIVDLRVDSPTFLKWFGAELSAENRTMMLVPKGFGHAFLTLEENTEALYLVTEFYSPENERGLRWNDPKIGIEWPIKPEVISEKDMNHPDFNLQYHCNQ